MDRHEAAAQGFDYRGTYTLFESDPLDWHSPVAGKLLVPERMQPFLAFRSQSQTPC